MLFLEPLWKVFPAFRKEDIDRVFNEQHYGNVNRVWMGSGLIVVSTDGGQRLHTICTQPVSSLMSSSHWSISIQLEQAVLDVLISSASGNSDIITNLYVVQSNGSVQCWQLGQENYAWKCIYRLSIQTTGMRLLSPSDCVTEVPSSQSIVLTNVCLLVDHNILFWCERNGPRSHRSHSIYKVQLPGCGDDINSLGKHIERTEILRNCPPCSLLTFKHSILIVPEEMMNGSAPFGIIYTPMEESCTLIFGKKLVQHQVFVKSGEPLSFKSLLMQYQKELRKTMSQFPAVLGSVFHPVNNQLHIIHQGGQLVTWLEPTAATKEMQCRHLCNFRGVDPKAKWLLSYTYLMATSANEARIWSLVTGESFPLMSIPERLGTFVLQNSMQLSGLFTKKNIFICQKKAEEYKTDCLPQGNQYRTEALNVAALDQERCKKPSGETLHKLQNLQTEWADKRYQQPTTMYTQLTDPFLDSYWQLESLWQNTVNCDEQVLDPFPSGGSTEDSVRQLLNPSYCLPPETRQIQMMILASQQPMLVLNSFKNILDLEADVNEKTLPMWQFILGLDNNDADKININLQLFETLCQLFFIEDPQYLVIFVDKAQLAYKFNVGVAAFTRERNVKKVYAQANACLPPPEASKHLWDAVEAKVQLILKSESGHSALKGQDLLLTYDHWESALSHLRQCIDDKQLFRQLLHFTLKALAKENILDKYIADLSGLLSVSGNISLMALIHELMDSTNRGETLLPTSTQKSSENKVTEPLFEDSPDIPYSCLQMALCSLDSMSLKMSPADSTATFDEDLSPEIKLEEIYRIPIDA